MFESFKRKRVEKLDTEIRICETYSKLYYDFWEGIRKNNPKNIKALNEAKFMYKKFKDRSYKLMRLRDKLSQDIG